MVADHFSILEHEEECIEELIWETLPNALLMQVEAKLPWYENLVNYLILE